MSRFLFGVAAAALALGGCYVEETPQYAPRCYTTACAGQVPVVVSVKTPAPRPATVPAPTTVPPPSRAPAPRIGPPVRTRCYHRRGRWVRVVRGWRRIPGRWICR